MAKIKKLFGHENFPEKVHVLQEAAHFDHTGVAEVSEEAAAVFTAIPGYALVVDEDQKEDASGDGEQTGTENNNSEEDGNSEKDENSEEDQNSDEAQKEDASGDGEQTGTENSNSEENETGVKPQSKKLRRVTPGSKK